MFLVRVVASLRSPLELALYLGYSSFQSQKQNLQGGVQARLISVASVNVPVLEVPPVIFAFPLTSLLELLELDFVLIAFFNFWALIRYNCWDSIQADSFISTTLSGTAHNQAHGHFEEAKLEKITL